MLLLSEVDPSLAQPGDIALCRGARYRVARLDGDHLWAEDNTRLALDDDLRVTRYVTSLPGDRWIASTSNGRFKVYQILAINPGRWPIVANDPETGNIHQFDIDGVARHSTAFQLVAREELLEAAHASTG